MSDQTVNIHVRFSPDGSVSDIGGLPEGGPPQDWYNTLSTAFGTQYQPYAGRRGLFRLSAAQLDSLKTEAAR